MYIYIYYTATNRAYYNMHEQNILDYNSKYNTYNMFYIILALNDFNNNLGQMSLHYNIL